MLDVILQYKYYPMDWRGRNWKYIEWLKGKVKHVWSMLCKSSGTTTLWSAEFEVLVRWYNT